LSLSLSLVLSLVLSLSLSLARAPALVNCIDEGRAGPGARGRPGGALSARCLASIHDLVLRGASKR